MVRDLNRLIRLFGSIKITIFLLFSLFFLILFATFSQVDLGIFEANRKYFSSWFVWMGPIPIYIGGYFIGLALLINLVCSHTTKLRLSKSYLGIFFIHFGLILLIIGSGITSFFGEEMQLSIQEGETKNFLVYPSEFELVIIDPSHPKKDRLFPISLKELQTGVHFDGAHIQAITFYENAIINQRGIENLKYNQLGQAFKLISMPKTYKMTERNIPGMNLMIKHSGGTDYYMVWGGSAIYQEISLSGHTYLIKLRPKRRYLDFSIQLMDFTRETYAKTETAKRFVSNIELVTNNGRFPFDIQMNEPLRYSGYTFFQSSFTEDEQTSVFQVVKNPSWTIPYLSSFIIVLGLFLQMILSMRRAK